MSTNNSTYNRSESWLFHDDHVVHNFVTDDESNVSTTSYYHTVVTASVAVDESHAHQLSARASSAQSDDKSCRAQNSSNGSDMFEAFIAKSRPTKCADDVGVTQTGVHELSSFIVPDDFDVEAYGANENESDETQSTCSSHKSVPVPNLQSTPRQPQRRVRQAKERAMSARNADTESSDESESDQESSKCYSIGDSDADDSECSNVASALPQTAVKTPQRRQGRIRTFSVDKQMKYREAIESSDDEKENRRPRQRVRNEESFLRALSPQNNRMHIDAAKYAGKSFKRNREELVTRLFAIYNKHVFNDLITSTTPVIWNARLRKTAGRCVYRRAGGTVERTCRIELSVKVCDTADRVRDTLIHEMCHAAVWLVNGDAKGAHGPKWKAWAYKAQKVYAQLPVISRCHAYEIRAKYIYRCVQCKQEYVSPAHIRIPVCVHRVKRHSKSLDIQRKVCGLCRGRFELYVNTTKGQHKQHATLTHAESVPARLNDNKTSTFATFVQQHYGSVKKNMTSQTHKDVMLALSAQFKSHTHLD